MSLLPTWDDVARPLAALRQNELSTLPTGLLHPQGQLGADHGGTMAFALRSVAPMVVLRLVFQRYFVQGFARSGIR